MGPLPPSARSPLIQAATRCGLHSLTGSIPPGFPAWLVSYPVYQRQFKLSRNSRVLQLNAAHGYWTTISGQRSDRQTDRETEGRTHTPAVPCALRPPLAPFCGCARAWGRVSGYRYVGHTPWPRPRTLGQSCRRKRTCCRLRPAAHWWQIHFVFDILYVFRFSNLAKYTHTYTPTCVAKAD